MDDVSVLLCGTRCLMHALCFLPKDDELPMNFELPYVFFGPFRNFS
jgi:hypothetical protein